MRRRRFLTVATALVVVGLVGCSVPQPYGLRLNADGTVDAVECYGMGSNFEVDYRLAGESMSSESPEWALDVGPDAEHHDPVVVRYGRAPAGSTTTVFEDPPEGWVEVWTSVGSADRGELIEGEWVWRATSDFPWEPEHPCDGVTADALER
jgi:hypothetical protein